MTLSARSAAVRGDDYQYLIAWVEVCRALLDGDALSVSVEDAGGGHFDDIVVRNRHGADRFFQVKSSNSGDVVVDDEWLTTAISPKGKSPLQHFHATWKSLSASGHPFSLTLLTNRGFDHKHPLLGPMRDNLDGRVRVAGLRSKSARTEAGKCRAAWATHLDVSEEEVLDFLEVVGWEQAGPESRWREAVKPLMQLNGLRDDDNAVELGRAMVRSWVTEGVGPQSVADIRRQLDEGDLLADSAVLTLAVEAIDRLNSPQSANVRLDFVDRYLGDEPRNRFQLRDSSEWSTVITPELQAMAASLESYRARRVRITGAMRLPLYFAIGRELPDVRGWVLSISQRGDEWSTDAPPAAQAARVVRREALGLGTDVAVAIALSSDPTEDVREYVTTSALPVGSLLTLGPEGSPGASSVPSNEWLTGWVRSAREAVRAEVRSTRATRVHLFMSAPAAAALMLGHQWNVMPSTMVYEFDRTSYFPTLG